MTEYLATFHTHLAALRSLRALTGAGLTAHASHGASPCAMP